MSILGAGRKRKYGGTVVSRKNLSYRNPKVFNKRYQRPSEAPKFHFTRKGIENTLIILGVLVLVYFIFYSKYFKIKDVIVEGNQTILTDDLISSVPVGANLLTLRTGPIKNDLKNKYPQIKDIAFFKGIPDAIKIQIVEREATLIWQTSGHRYLVDPEGVVNRQLSSEEVTSLPIVSDSRNRLVQANDYLVTADFINFVTYMNTNFFEVTNIKLTSMSIDETTYDLVATTDANIKIFFDTTKNPTNQLENLKKILVNYRDKITEYIDLRVEGWGYYK